MRLSNFTLPVDANQKDLALAYKDLSVLYSYNASGNVDYIGKAVPGTLSSSAAWQIKRFQWNLSNGVTNVMYASGSMDFAFSFNSAATYSYL